MLLISILHLEDSPLDAELAAARLAKGGLDCQVTRVDTREGFIAALETGGYDAILSDFALPNFDGASALALAQERCPQIPFIFVSGKLGEEVAIDTLKQGATDYVLKQRLDRLVPAVQRALMEARERAQKREMEQALHLSEERMRVAVKNSPLILYTADRNQRYTWVGKSHAHFAPGALLGKRDDDLLPREDVAEWMALKQSVLDSGVGDRRIVRIQVSGRNEIYDVTVEPLRDEREQVNGITVAAVDITELHHNENMLRQRQAEIEQLNARLQRAMMETHHRVKNNMQVLAAIIDMQTMDAGAMLPISEFKRLSSQIKTLATVHDILTREAKGDGQAHTLNAGELLALLIPLLRSLTTGQELILAVTHNTSLTARQGTSLALALNELVSNAIKHGKGDVCVTYGVEGTGENSANHAQAVLQVRDHGDGFPPDFNPRLMARTGLELVQSLANWDLSGSIAYENHPAGGASVTIRLPL